MKWLLVIFLSFSLPAKEPGLTTFFEAVLNEDLTRASELLLPILYSSQSISEKKLLVIQVKELEEKSEYKMHFGNVIVELEEKKCGDLKMMSCGRYRDFWFQVDRRGKKPSMRLYKKSQLIFEHDLVKRTGLFSSNINFGGAIHLIEDKRNSNVFYFLLRELEVRDHLSRPVLQTMNLFKFDNNEVCRLAIMDMTDYEEPYETLVILARNLGNKLKCPTNLLTF